MPRQLWLPDVLREAGLEVKEAPGWQTRGTATFDPIGVMWHHTASGKNWTDQSLTNLLVNGRSDLKGPLCHLQLNRDGSYVVIAAGRSNHAGTGRWNSITAGNTNFIGIEAANDGVGEPWPQVQLDAYYVGTAAIVKYIKGSAGNVIGHKEWTSRKIDPRGIDMNEARHNVSKILSGESSSAPRPPRRPNVPSAQAKNPVIRYGARGEAVLYAQTLLSRHGINVGRADGAFGPATDAGVKKFQAEKGLKNDGIIGSLTWSALERTAKSTETSSKIIKVAEGKKVNIHERCKKEVFRVGSRGSCVASLQRALNTMSYKAGTPDGVFGPKTELAVKNFQKDNRLFVDGIVGPRTWLKLQ